MQLSVITLRDLEQTDVVSGLDKNDFIPQGTQGKLKKAGLISATIEFDGFGEVQMSHQYYMIEEIVHEGNNRNG